MTNLQNKRALIIGGTKGIGLAVARHFIAAGAEVMIAGRSHDGTVQAEAIGAAFTQCDISEENSVEACLKEAKASLVGLNVLVINAGIAFDEGSIEAFSTELMTQMMDVNFKGAFFCLKHAPALMEDGSSIIYTGSVAGSGITHAGSAVYSASKAAGAYLVRTSAIENAPRGIRVNCVAPGLIADTGMMVPDDGNETAKFLSHLNAFGRLGHQNEVTGIYAFLAGDESKFITGQELRVDGGMTAGFGLPLFGGLEGG